MKRKVTLAKFLQEEQEMDSKNNNSEVLGFVGQQLACHIVLGEGESIVGFSFSCICVFSTAKSY